MPTTDLSLLLRAMLQLFQIDGYFIVHYRLATLNSSFRSLTKVPFSQLDGSMGLIIAAVAVDEYNKLDQ